MIQNEKILAAGFNGFVGARSICARTKRCAGNFGKRRPYGIQVIDKDGNVVNEIEGKEQRDISGIEAIGRDYEFFEMRREIMWDLRGTDGELVPDGEYVVRVWVEDANRNRSELDIEKFIVDTVAPTVELAFKDGADSQWFSPKGQRKTAEILVNGAEEALWVLQIVDEEDEPVVTKRLSDSALEEFIWDGCDDNGNFVADGNYAFKVMGEDYAGNKSEPALLAGIRVDNRPTAVTASAEFDGFSPNGDGKRDTLDVKLDYKLSTDFVSWSWRIEKTENPESTDAETAAGEGPQPTMKSGDVVEMDEEPAAVSEEAAADNNSDETAVDAPVAVRQPKAKKSLLSKRKRLKKHLSLLKRKQSPERRLKRFQLKSLMHPLIWKCYRWLSL